MQSLKRTDSNYKRLLANETEALMVLGESVQDCNASALALLRCERNDLVGHPLQRRAPPLQPDGAASTEVLRQRMEAARGGSRHWFPWQFVLADGAPIETLVQLEAMELDGQPHWLVRLADLSRLRQAERALQETESRLQQILEHSPTVVFVKDIEGRYLFTNQRFREMFPPSNGSDAPTRDKELFPPEVVARLRADERLVLEKRSPIEVEVDLVVAGEECTYLVVKFPLLDGNGDPYAVCGIATDITAGSAMRRIAQRSAGSVHGRGPVVYQELTRYLATTLGVECCFHRRMHQLGQHARAHARGLHGSRVREQYRVRPAGHRLRHGGRPQFPPGPRRGAPPVPRRSHVQAAGHRELCGLSAQRLAGLCPRAYRSDVAAPARRS